MYSSTEKIQHRCKTLLSDTTSEDSQRNPQSSSTHRPVDDRGKTESDSHLYSFPWFLKLLNAVVLSFCLKHGCHLHQRYQPVFFLPGIGLEKKSLTRSETPLLNLRPASSSCCTVRVSARVVSSTGVAMGARGYQTVSRDSVWWSAANG